MIPSIILAAGRGSRMGALARGRPKCLLRLGGRSLLDWQRSAIAAAGLAPPIVVGGYAQQYLRPISGERLVINSDWANSGPIGSLRCVPSSLVRDGFVLVYGDVVVHPQLLALLRDCTAPLAITVDLDWLALWSLRFSEVLDDAESLRWGNQQGSIVSIGGRAAELAGIEGQFTGLLRVSALGWQWITTMLDGMPHAQVQRLDTTAMLAGLLACGHGLVGLPIRGQWLEIDSADDLRSYRQRLRRRAPWSHDWRWAGA